MIYLDNAATSYQKPEAVYQAVQEAMRETHPGWRLRPIPPKA